MLCALALLVSGGVASVSPVRADARAPGSSDLALEASQTSAGSLSESDAGASESDTESDTEIDPESDTEVVSDRPLGATEPAQAAPARAKTSRRGAAITRRAPAAAVAAPVPTRTDHDLRPLASSPVPGVESSGFGWRDDPFNSRRKFHKGTDFRAPRGTAVYAAGGGVVLFAGRMGGYGNAIFIDHGDGVVTRYGHLRVIGVTKGATVASGSKVGEVGSTGRATGPHLHFEVRLDGRAVNPKVAMTIANLQRTDPLAARTAAVALAPEVQAASIDPHPRPGKRAKSARPERRGRGKRKQVLW